MSEDLYTRLLAAIEAKGRCDNETWSCAVYMGEAGQLTTALRAVVELHKPRPCENECCSFCAGCEDEAASVYWPCSTVKAIAEALGLSSGTEGDPR